MLILANCHIPKTGTWSGRTFPFLYGFVSRRAGLSISMKLMTKEYFPKVNAKSGWTDQREDPEVNLAGL